MEKKKVEQQSTTNQGYEELSKLYLFGEFYSFVKQSTGLAIAIAYIAMTLSSMLYLKVFFSKFDIAIVKFLTFEDILATPIKNPDIILVFAAVVCVLYLADMANRFRARLAIKYSEEPAPLWARMMLSVFYAPKKRKSNILLSIFVVVISLFSYILMVASLEAMQIQKGKSGEYVEITLVENSEKLNRILLGTTLNYVFTYNRQEDEAVVYYVEAINSLKVIPMQLDKQEMEVQTKSAG